jgi:hypothetical protein
MRPANPWWERLACFLALRGSNQAQSSPDIYSEALYRELIHGEFKRSERSGQLCRILLIYRTNAQNVIVPLGSEFAETAASVLFNHVRETDYIGWYRHGWIMGILLTALRPDSADDGRDGLKNRLVDRFSGALMLTDDHALQIEVLDQDELRAFSASDDTVPFPADSKG